MFPHDGITDISFTIHEADLKQTKELLGPVVTEIGANGLDHAKRRREAKRRWNRNAIASGVAARMFQCWPKAGINIQLISTSDIKIAVIIEENELERAAQLTHEASVWRASRRSTALTRSMPAGS